MNIFSEEMLNTFDASILPTNEASLLPKEVYTSEEFFQFEKEAIFDHEWLCVGRADQIPTVGDYLVVTLSDEQLIVVRSKDGIRVMSAVCQHRGMVLAEKAGNCARFTCPYHHWTYALDGKLVGMPEMNKAQGFEKSEFDLPSLPVEIWQGFIFTSFDKDISPLAPSLSALDPFLEHFDLPGSTTRSGVKIPGLPWNWKVMMENFNDPYHASRLHGPLQTFAPSGMSDFFDWSDDMNHISRIQHFTEMDGSFNPTKKNLLPVFPKLSNEERKRGMFILIPPTLALAVVPDEIAYFIIDSQSAGEISIDINYCFDPQAEKDPMFEYLFEQAEAGVNNFNVQDIYANSMVQKGFNSRLGSRGRYSWQEGTLPQFNRWLVQRYSRHWPANS
jgi:nitrite reductase/ring-hydroxylating ferredoxin subunit